MEGIKTYILPGVAVLLLVAYYVFRPDPAELEPEPGDPPTQTGAAPKGSHAPDTRTQILDAVGQDAPELPKPHVTQQLEALSESVTQCSGGKSTALNVTLVGAPGLGTVIEEVAGADARIDPGVVSCVQQAVAKTELPAPSAAGRSTISHIFE